MVNDGQTAKVHYKGSLDDGTVFDSSQDKEPIVFEMGAGQVIPGFESAVREMEIGETKTVTLPAAQGYGEVRDDMIADIPRSQFPEHIELKPGLMLQMRTEDGALPIEVVAVTDESVKVDANHPLAGKELTFELTLLEVA